MGKENKKSRLRELEKKIKVFQKKIDPLRKESNKLRDKIGFEECKKMVGKTFKYHNSYGFGDKWWLYAKIIGAGSYDVTVLTCQKVQEKDVEIKIETHSSSAYRNGGYYTPIKSEVFDKEFDKLMKELKKKAVIKNG